jgi:hypothetical protein
MQGDPDTSSISSLQTGGASLPPPMEQPPVIPLVVSSWRRPIAILLSLGFGLFLLEAVVSLVDDSFIVFFHVHLLSGLRGLLFVFTILSAIVIYGLIGIIPAIPKRYFLPVALFGPVAMFAGIPFLIYHFDRMMELQWATSLCQVIVGLGICYRLQGGFKFRWPLVTDSQLAGRGFGWLNLLGFVLVNAFVLLPATLAYLFFCSSLAVGHFSDGFVALRPAGLTVQVRKYVRDDGKTVLLIPMTHVGEAAFYRNLSKSFPTNSTVLMEGVSDKQNMLTNRISYKRMAATLGVAEQHNEFRPQGEMVIADVDIGEFAPSTIGLLNQVMLIHSKGLNAQTISTLMQAAPSPEVQAQLWEDLLHKRNRHLIKEIEARLPKSDYLIVPWGAAHIPEIAREIQKSGFRVTETQDLFAIRFH